MTSLYSHSRLSSFENCKKQFHFRYILRIPALSEGVEAFVGKRVHEVLERLYRFVGRSQLPSLDRVLQRYDALWDEHWDGERVRIVKQGMSAEQYRQIGSQCLSFFYRKHYPFDADETLGIEQRVVFALDEARRYKMQGIVDRIVRSPDGVIEIHDYKTGGYVPSQKRLDDDRQLALYQIGLQQDYGPDAPMRLVWHYLARGQTRTSTRSPEQLALLGRETIALIDRIGTEQEFAAERNRLCDWCEYKAICPAWTDAPAEAWPHLVALAGDVTASRPEPDAENGSRVGGETQLDLL